MEISTRLAAVPRNMSVAGLLLVALLALPFGLVSCKHRGNREIEDPQAFGPPCRTYHSSKCALIHKAGAPTEPFCHPGNASQHACTFDTSALITCPLSQEGHFVKDEILSQQCNLHTRSHRRVFANPSVPPMCGPNCCSADLPGTFQRRKDNHFHVGVQFQPNATDCHYHQYNWREAFECLEGVRIVIAGDSIMRQLFNMAITMFRGQEVAVDYNKHAHGRYRVCREGDRLEFGSFVPVRWEIPLEEMEMLFTPKNDSFALCSGKSLVEIDYLWAPRFMDLVPSLQQYQKVVASKSRQRVVYITFAGFWEDQPTVSEEFLSTLDVLRKTAEAVMLVGVPRVRLYDEPNANALIRNEKMRQWVSNRTEESGNVHYVDFDLIAHAEGAPPGMGSLNWHFQCFLDHLHLNEVAAAVGHLNSSWYWAEVPDHIYPSVWTGDHGECTDDMDRNLWQIMFNLLCNARDRIVDASTVHGKDPLDSQ